jgi:tyrosine-protein phosphatase SIW14
MGITTVVSLRDSHSDREKIRDTGLAYEHIYVKAWHPEEEDIVRFLRIVANPTKTPVLVHCQHGADRTGTMLAIYRIAVEGWTKEEAIEEMTKGGFGFHEAWVNLAPWIRGLDIDKIKREAGLAST